MSMFVPIPSRRFQELIYKREISTSQDLPTNRQSIVLYKIHDTHISIVDFCLFIFRLLYLFIFFLSCWFYFAFVFSLHELLCRLSQSVFCLLFTTNTAIAIALNKVFGWYCWRLNKSIASLILSRWEYWTDYCSYVLIPDQWQFPFFLIFSLQHSDGTLKQIWRKTL